MDQHWVNVDAGCRDAAGERAVKYQWMAPDKKDDAMQIEKINNAVASGANAILVAANNPTGVNSALQEAADKGIIIVYVDSPAEFPAIATVATNNKAAGRSAGEEMLKALAAGNVTSGTIGVISVNAATQSVVDRDAGFREALAGSEFEVLETQYGEGDAAKSKEIGDAYITQGVVGIYGTNEGSSIGAGNAIKDSGKDVVGVGFDYGDAAAQLIKDGALLCVMAQEPYQMGYKGLNIAVQALRGEAIPETNIDSGATAIFD
ncbi:MAG: substrate-binding domain-containing protein [Oscillospiraceae bacterium]|nr:substrate-binding domain-containing protein [Oscillospiraceae bacterium]